jgi:putative ABC transport system permease protein
MESLWQDVRYGLRSLLKSSEFTVVTVLTLALGIGANTAIFSVVNGLLLNALPYPEADQLVMVWNDNRRAGLLQDASSYANLVDYRSQSQSFQNIAAFADLPVVFSDTEEPVAVPGAIVSSEFFTVMEVYPLLGRAFSPEDDNFAAEFVVILSYGFWQRDFGGDADIIGKAITLSHRPIKVIGVMPPDFQFPPKADLWLNLPASSRQPEFYTSRMRTAFNAIGRLRPGVSLMSARAEMSTIASRLEQQYPKENEGYGVTLIPLREQWLGEIATMLWVLFGAVGLVLLIACVNTASLLLARVSARRKEFAVRLALGAGRARLMRQLLTESLLLAALGTVAGVALAWVGVKLFAAANPFDIWRLDRVSLDGRVLFFTVMVCVLTGLLFGLVPARQASNQRMAETLKEGSQSVTVSRTATRLRELLVTVEVALALILLVGAGLMIRSFRQLQNVDLGFSTERLLTFRFRLPSLTYNTEEKLTLFHRQLLEHISALPGVKAAGASDDMFVKGVTTTLISIEGHSLSESGKTIEVPAVSVSASFFPTMGIPLRRGRMFTEQDQPKSQPVVIVNESMAKRFWPDNDPVGKRIKIPDYVDDWAQVVGIVADYRHVALETEAQPEIYVANEQFPQRAGQLIVRTEVEPLGLVPTIRQCVRDLDRSLPVRNLQSMEQLLSDNLAPRYCTSLLLSVFALMALILAAVGVFGVLSYQVRQRTHEIGIRMALGARPRQIITLIVRRGIILALIGVAAGLAGSLALSQLISGLLYGVSASDPINLLTVSLVLVGTTVLASYLPARRATKVEPIAALRYE